ncbi:MAG: hypothetical protein KJ754_06640 [Bacteroidetes bacterium]|nr:hypothetical protein [Bacteroidota bacterium]MBU1579087.1 hypothetical protein [Bacteroidota bacterium]MBU2464750.1 hypothetical protein [Bacteroidota bacterium]
MTNYGFVFSAKSMFLACLTGFFTLLLSINVLPAQQAGVQLLELKVQNESLGTILDQLFEKHKIKVAFNASDPVFDEMLTMDLKATPEQLLETLLKDRGYHFRKIGDQYIVYKQDQADDQTENEAEITPSEQPNNAGQALGDTIFIRENLVRTDTIVRFDTIVKQDTLVIYDTITIYREPPAETKRAKIKPLRSDIFNQDARRQQGQAFEVYYGRAVTFQQFVLLDESEAVLKNHWNNAVKTSFRSHTLGFKWHFNAQKWHFSSGLALTGFAEKFSYSRRVSTGGFFDVDTLDTYYTISGADTSWFHVKDSSWIPLDERNYDYSTLNRMGYLEWQTEAAYRMLSFPGVGVYLRAGFGISALIYQSGTGIGVKPDYEAIPLKELEMETFKFSWMLGVNARMRLSDAFDLVPELYYRSYSGNLYKNYPIERKQGLVGINLGLIYYF